MHGPTKADMVDFSESGDGGRGEAMKVLAEHRPGRGDDGKHEEGA
jgi:hypothetical protein